MVQQALSTLQKTTSTDRPALHPSSLQQRWSSSWVSSVLRPPLSPPTDKHATELLREQRRSDRTTGFPVSPAPEQQGTRPWSPATAEAIPLRPRQCARRESKGSSRLAATQRSGCHSDRDFGECGSRRALQCSSRTRSRWTRDRLSAARDARSASRSGNQRHCSTKWGAGDKGDRREEERHRWCGVRWLTKRGSTTNKQTNHYNQLRRKHRKRRRL